MKMKFTCTLLGIVLITGCTLLKDKSVDADKFMKTDDFPVTIYSKPTNGVVYSPFSMHIDNAEKLILFDFKGNSRYKFLECQFYNNEEYGQGIVCMLMRHDDRLEMYHTEGLTMKQQLYYFDSLQRSIPINVFNPEYSFTYSNGQLDFNLKFNDKYGNSISASLNGYYPENIDFIVPVGLVNNNYSSYSSFPVFYMKELNFLNTKEGKASITINDTIYTIKKIPGIVNWKKVYMARWSFNPVFILWNENRTNTIKGLANNDLTTDSVSYKINDQNGYMEIESIEFRKEKHTAGIEFSPKLPELICLKEDIELSGRFIINVDDKRGVYGGKYFINRDDNEIILKLQPTKGYQPTPGKTWVKNLYLEIKIAEYLNGEIFSSSKWVIQDN
jgi:hypothetical protein